MSEPHENNVPPAFPHTKAIRRRLDWRTHVDLFAGGGKRLTAKTFRAYMGYLLVLFLLFVGVVGVPAALIAYVAAISGVTALKFLAGFLAVVIFGGILWFLQNAFWGLLYRFHDLGFGGGMLFLFVTLAFLLNRTTGFLMAGAGLYASVGIFSALFGLVPYLASGKRGKNKYGFPVEYRWYSFPTPVRVCGEIMFWLAVAYVAKEVYDIFTASTIAPPSIFDRIIDMMRSQQGLTSGHPLGY